MKIKGIDVSSHNGTIDFESVKNSGVEVVIIKATEGVDFVDNLLEQNYNGANGIIPHIGFYHFMSEKTDPSEQAEDFYNAIKGKTYDVKPCLDIEVNNYGRSATEITDRCLAFINRFKELSGQDIIIYTGGYFGRDNLDSRIKCYGGWIAHYGVDSPMETGFPLVGHQYSESGKVSGIRGNVDMDNFYEGIFMNGSYVPSPQPTSEIHDIVLKLQQLINEQGFGPVAEDGIPGNETLNHCPLIREGARGEITKCLQKFLNRFGYNLVEDGIFGEGTKNAVMEFQNSKGLEADGVVGKNTWRALLGL
ncbi:GH25 family lysozyme [Clostridium cibarium]|uniref:Lysozyme n=1 Tax=Clostridium cibarium TaxID=2762247 RepID=A0ABR8PTE5_9CLOT|nr:GH25 family lysozyme [Clostridium cibarium]MBD7911444.1 peptidoglycan-binding protein [Clostridium cibarium]